MKTAGSRGDGNTLPVFENKDFEGLDGQTSPLPAGVYDDCRFSHCDLMEADLSGYRFIDCTFTHCNLSLAKTEGTALRNIAFRECKMLALRFDLCHPLGLSFSTENCQLHLSSFYKTAFRRAVFRNTDLQEVDFKFADLTGAIFDHCNLNRADFEETTLVKADFRTAFNFIIHPVHNRIRGAKFSLHGLPGLVKKFGIDIEI